MSDGFEQFWAKWPKRVARKDAMKAWGQVHGDAHLDAILAALAWQTRQPQWTKDDGQYVPHAATWLRGERWTDECPALLRAALVVASEPPEAIAARRARVEAETAERFARERAQFGERRRA